MFVGLPPVTTTGFSTSAPAVTGVLFFIPSMPLLESLADDDGDGNMDGSDGDSDPDSADGAEGGGGTGDGSLGIGGLGGAPPTGRPWSRRTDCPR